MEISESLSSSKRFCLLGLLQVPPSGCRFRGDLALANERACRFDNASLFKRDPCEWLLRNAFFWSEQEPLVIDAQRCNPANCRLLDHIGCVEPSAEADLDVAQRFGEVGRRKFGRAG